MAERPPMIFISYRGGDETWASDLVFTSLAATFGTDAVFKAGYGLRAGEDYPPILERMAAACPVMLVCIGPRWLAAENVTGDRRLDEPTDWVRREIDIALRSGNHVIPLLLGNYDAVVVPPPEELPPDIAPLVRRQAFRLEPGGRLRITLPDLAARLAELVPSLAMRKPATGTFSVTQKVGTLAGNATLARTPEGFAGPAELTQEVETVTETGNAVALEVRDVIG